MSIRMKARPGEGAEQLMRRFKKLCEKEGQTKDIKRRAYYEKPCERKQRALRKSVKRMQQITLGIPPRKGPNKGPASGPVKGTARSSSGSRR